MSLELAERIARLDPVSRKILELSLERLEGGREEYGSWDLASRDWLKEGLEEMVDGLHYLAAEMIRRMEEGS